MSRRYWLLYPAWIVLCATLFFALRGAEDPSRRHGRILSNDAADIAVRVVRQQPQFRGYEAVHVAYASRSETGTTNRWIVLCDAVPHTALARAVVVELDAADGRLLAMRKPVH